MSTPHKLTSGFAWKLTSTTGPISNLVCLSVARVCSTEAQRLTCSTAGVDFSSGIKFRLKDDDGVLYATGLITGPDLDWESDTFAPLDYFQASWGVTSIEYQNAGGTWEAA